MPLTQTETLAPSNVTFSREQLILQHLPQVHLIAKRIHRGLPTSVSLDDLISTGTIGLIAAIDRYDTRQEVKLKTYAEYKIRGAILDSLRGLDWAPRQKRKRAKQIETAIANIEKEKCRAASEEEIARFLEISLDEYRSWLADSNGLTMNSLEAPNSDEDGRELLRFVSGSEEEWPSELFERAELARLLAEAIEKMPPSERTVLKLYFYEEMTLRDISKIVELHESRVSQLKTQGILRLRAYLQTYWPFQRNAPAAQVRAATR